MFAFNLLSSKQDVPKTNAHVCEIWKTSVNKYSRYYAETKGLQTVKRTDGHSDNHLENMTWHTKVWRSIKGWFRSVPQSTNSQGC